MPSQLPVLAAIAARTERIRLGTGVLLAPLFDPVHLAEDAATVDLLSNGRLILGVGLGWRQEEFDGFGVPIRERPSRLEGVITTLRQAWGDGLTTGDGKRYAVPGSERDAEAGARRRDPDLDRRRRRAGHAPRRTGCGRLPRDQRLAGGARAAGGLDA